MTVRVEHGDSREVIKSLADCSVDSCVTDPPYSLVSIRKWFGKPGSAPVRVGDANATNDLKAAYARASAGFMGKQWDTGETAHDPHFWAEVYRVLKPGAHLVAFAGTRTYHRMVCAIEDAGFEIRDQLGWCFGSGFPKSHDVAKGIDRHNGINIPAKESGGGSVNTYGDGLNVAWGSRTPHRPFCDEAQRWAGWGTALKPAWEPICLARRPLCGTVAANVLRYGTGALNIDACRIDFASEEDAAAAAAAAAAQRLGHDFSGRARWVGQADTCYQNPGKSLETWNAKSHLGRWPANLVHDGSDEVVAAFPFAGGQQRTVSGEDRSNVNVFSTATRPDRKYEPRGDLGSAARFFYTAKADADDRCDSKHPTVKPVSLMRWLARLITPPGGTVLDPFAGSGTTGIACIRECFNAILIEREDEYVGDIQRRLARLSGADTPLFGAERAVPTLFDLDALDAKGDAAEDVA